MVVGMIGRKVGMMRLYDGSGRVRAVTAIELGPNRVTQLRSDDRDGYEAVQVGHRGDRKRLTRPARGHLRQAGVEEPLGALREFRTDDSAEYSLGQELRVDRFSPGAFVDVSGVSKGRGFAGVVKRWGFHGGPKSHGQSDKHRGPGSIGAGTTPGRVWRGQKMAGHMGARNKTVRNLLVVLTDTDRNLLFVEGSVPGPRNGIVVVRVGRRSALRDYEPPSPLPAVESVEVEQEQETEAAAEAVDATATAETAETTETSEETSETPESTESEPLAEASLEEPSSEEADAGEEPAEEQTEDAEDGAEDGAKE